MTNPFKKAPVATLISVMTTVFAVAVYLQGAGIVTGQAGVWLDGAVGVLQVVLGLYARSHATPVANPKNNKGQALYPAHRPPAGSL